MSERLHSYAADAVKPLTLFGDGERCDTEPFCETDEHPVPE